MNQIKQGYKQTKVGMIPEDWEVEKIEKIAPLQRGYDLPTDSVRDGIYPVVYSNGILRFHNEYKAKSPGIITGRSGTIGKVTYVENNYWPHNTSLWVTNFYGNNPKFIYYMYINMDLTKFSAGSGVPTLNRNDVHIQNIALPPLKEQQKIAEILTTWDDAISKQEELIEAKIKQKKALSQKLLSGEVRFSGFSDKWKEVRLGEICKITTGSSNREDSSESKGEYTFFDRSQDIRTSDIYLFDGEAIIVAGEGQEFIPKYFVGKFDLHQRTYAIMEFKLNCGKFLFYYLYQNRDYFYSQAVGSTVKSLRLPMFQKMKLKLPSLPEQQKIAEVLSLADDEINLLKNELEELKQQKKALMQKLLTGEVRVKV